MPDTLPARLNAYARSGFRRPFEMRYPENSSKLSSGIGSPAMPNIIKANSPTYPYCTIQSRTNSISRHCENSSRRLRYDSDMAQMANQLIEVACPCCGATLRIDPETRAVIHHHEPEKKPLIEDLHTAVQQLKGEADRRSDV